MAWYNPFSRFKRQEERQKPSRLDNLTAHTQDPAEQHIKEYISAMSPRIIGRQYNPKTRKKEPVFGVPIAPQTLP